MSLLHHVVLPAESSRTAEASDRCILVLHGILGSGSNLRAVANALLAADPHARCVLVDLRMHGRSQGFAGPQTVDACARDLDALSRSLPTHATEVIGHSFGGKVAVAYLRDHPELKRIALLDSSPLHRPDRHGSEQTMAVIDMLDALPDTFASRAAFVEHVHAQGFSRMIADWLAMNLDRTDAGFRFRLDLTAIRALIEDYFAHDLWPVLENTQARVDLVIGGRSQVWGQPDIQKAQALADRNPKVRVHMLPKAGHWVHVEDPDGLTLALTSP